MEDDWKKELDKLVAAAKTPKEVRKLLGALLTPQEYDEIARRWHIVTLLIEGRPQRAIRDAVGVSIATVTRGAREVQYGDGVFQKFYNSLHKTR